MWPKHSEINSESRSCARNRCFSRCSIRNSSKSRGSLARCSSPSTPRFIVECAIFVIRMQKWANYFCDYVACCRGTWFYGYLFLFLQRKKENYFVNILESQQLSLLKWAKQQFCVYPRLFCIRTKCSVDCGYSVSLVEWWWCRNWRLFRGIIDVLSCV